MPHRDRGEEDGLNLQLWLYVAGITILGVIGAGVIFLLIGAAWYAWGFIGAMAFFGLLALAWAFYYDRKHPKDPGYEEA